jgi:transposase
MMQELKKRYEGIIGKKADITVVFDRGNNSEQNISLLESKPLPMYYVGGLKSNQVPELFAVPKEQYKPLGGTLAADQTAYRMTTTVFGRSLTTVIVYNPELERGQLQGILINQKKTEEKLLALQERLSKRAAGSITRGKKPTVESVQEKVRAILSIEYMESIFSYEISLENGVPLLSFCVSKDAIERIRHDQLGKTALFTNRSDFSNEQIVSAYRSAWHVENAFKQMKNTEHLSVRPIFHWTDEKIRVHIFTCVLAYRLCCLLKKELHDRGIKCSINRMLNEAGSIKKIITFFGNPDKPDKVTTFAYGGALSHEIDSLYQLTKVYS